MTTYPFDLISTEVAAFNNHEIERFLDTFAEDARLEGLSGASGPLVGREAMRKHFEGSMKQPGLSVEILSRVSLGPWIVDHEIVHRADAAPVEQLAIYELRDELIARVTVLAAQAQPVEA